MKILFGKYKGVELEEIPTEYLEWVVGNVERINPYVLAAIKDELDIRRPSLFKKSTKQAPELLTKTSLVYKTLSKKYHPDVGGNTQAMQALNEFYENLKEILR